MTGKAKRQARIIVGKIFELLMEHPEGLSSKQIWEHLQRVQVQESANGNHSQGWTLPTFEVMTFRCVAPIRAGWLQINRHHWTLSEEGRQAYLRFQNPEKIMVEAGRLSRKGWLSVHLPRSYSLAGKVKDQVTSEYRAANRIGLGRLFKEALSSAPKWQEVLPLQVPRRAIVQRPDPSRQESLLEYLHSLATTRNEGGHAIYLPPGSLKDTVLAELAGDYPRNAGIKIVKSPGGVDNSEYMGWVVKGDSMIHRKLAHGHRQLTLVANLLYSKGVGPRLYDLLEIQYGDQLWTAYVSAHIEGGKPSVEECEVGIGKLRALDREGLLKATPREGFDDEEFSCPNCCGNALVDEKREFKYVDFQNFFLAEYEAFLTAIALEAAEKSHFGDESLLRGGKYLYQSVPGVRLPAKRSVADRIIVLNQLMESCGVTVKDRLVLDVGCNIGMMIGQYLKLGAKWCHGWDRAHVTPHTQKLLLALGCTRFSTTGGDISESQPMETNLPDFLKPHLEGCVISYLAVRAHIGWLAALARIRWSFLIYEGHEGETREDFDNDMKQFRSLTDFEIGAVSEYVDGDSDPRTIAILVRKAQ